MTDSFELCLFLGGYRCAADRRNGGRLPASNPDCPKLCQRLLQSGFLYAKEDKLAAGIELYTQAIEIGFTLGYRVLARFTAPYSSLSLSLSLNDKAIACILTTRQLESLLPLWPVIPVARVDFRSTGQPSFCHH